MIGVVKFCGKKGSRPVCVRFCGCATQRDLVRVNIEYVCVCFKVEKLNIL